MNAPEETPAGLTGYVSVAIVDPARPGEVQVPIRGGTEAFIAYAEVPIPRGTTVLVVSYRGGRSVDVIAG